MKHDSVRRRIRSMRVRSVTRIRFNLAEISSGTPAARCCRIGLAIGVVAALAACSGTASSFPSTLPPSTAAPASSPSPSASGTAAATPAASPSGATTATATGTATAGATFTYQDSDGDSLTETYTFGAPVPATQLSDVYQAAGGCYPGSPSQSAALVFPVAITTTLNSDVSTNVVLSFDSVPLTVPQSAPADESDVFIPVFVYYYSDGSYDCSLEGAGNDGTAGYLLSLSPGVPAKVEAWVVLNGAIFPKYPNGNPASIGVTGFWPNITPGFMASGVAGSLAVSGPAVCTQGDTSGDSAFLHFGGTVFGWEDCGSKLTSDY